MELDNWKPSANDYERFNKWIGHRFKISYRVVSNIKSTHAQMFGEVTDDDDKLVDQLVEMRRKFEKDITRMNESIRPRKIAAIGLISRQETTINSVTVRCNKLNKLMPDLLSSIENVAVRKATVKFLKDLERDLDKAREFLGITISKELLEDVDGQDNQQA